MVQWLYRLFGNSAWNRYVELIERSKGFADARTCSRVRNDPINHRYVATKYICRFCEVCARAHQLFYDALNIARFMSSTSLSHASSRTPNARVLSHRVTLKIMSRQPSSGLRKDNIFLAVDVKSFIDSS